MSVRKPRPVATLARCAPRVATLGTLLCGVLLAGCEWVDSAGDGEGGTAAPATPVAVQTITLDEQPLNGATAVMEDSMVRLAVSRGGDALRDARLGGEALDSGVLDTCLAIEGFDADSAADSLEDACNSDESACEVSTGRDDTDDEIGLTFDLPAVKAPVGLRYQVSLGRNRTDDDGDAVFEFIEDDVRQIDLCVLSTNDVPISTDDTYVVLETQTLDVDAVQGVLANDMDDEDITNRPLAATLVSEPTRADSFTMEADGGFVYVPAEAETGADVLDTFTYRADDGSNDSDIATVTVRTVTTNQAPRPSEPLPVVEARVGTFVSFDFADFFVDPEGGRLTFEFVEPLPDAGSLSLTRDGALVGVPGAADAGDYALTLDISDGSAQVSVPVTLSIEGTTSVTPPAGPPSANGAPVFVAGSVFNQSIRLGVSITTVRPQFEDPDDDALSFSLGGTTDLPAGLSLNAVSGAVSGRPRQRGLIQDLVVEAMDTAGNTANSTPFTIRIR